MLSGSTIYPSAERIEIKFEEHLVGYVDSETYAHFCREVDLGARQHLSSAHPWLQQKLSNGSSHKNYPTVVGQLEVGRLHAELTTRRRNELREHLPDFLALLNSASQQFAAITKRTPSKKAAVNTTSATC